MIALLLAAAAAQPGLTVTLLDERGGELTVSAGGRAVTVTLRDDGLEADRAAADGAWTAAVPALGREYQLTLTRGDQRWRGTLAPTGDPPALVVWPSATGRLVALDLGERGVSDPDLAVNPWSPRRSPPPPWHRPLLAAALVLGAGVIARRLRAR